MPDEPTTITFSIGERQIVAKPLNLRAQRIMMRQADNPLAMTDHEGQVEVFSRVLEANQMGTDQLVTVDQIMNELRGKDQVAKFLDDFNALMVISGYVKKGEPAPAIEGAAPAESKTQTI